MRPSKEAFVAHWKHEFAGMVLDAALNTRRGAELSFSLANLMDKIEARLGQIYGQLASDPIQIEKGRAVPDQPAPSRRTG